MVSVNGLPFSFDDDRCFEFFCQLGLHPSAKHVPQTSLTHTLKKLVPDGKNLLI